MRYARDKSRRAARETLWDEMWNRRYRELVAFVVRHGHANVPKRHRNHTLANWVKTQRERRRGTPRQRPPKPWQVKMLDRLSFIWDGRELKWRANFHDLCQFKATYGHCEIRNADDPRLVRWLAVQRQLKRQRKLRPAYKAMLDSIDFPWDGQRSQRNRERAWRRMYGRLKQYRTRQGDTNVPRNWPEDPSLAIWVGVQRQCYQEGELPEQRIAMLQRIGFVWRLVNRGRWEDHFAEAVAFKARYGHCRIRGTCRRNSRLERWARRMQTRRNCGQLAADRVARLDAIGFDWSSNHVFVLRERWQERYEQLVDFHRRHGHCNVPCEWAKNKPLARWVAKQRTANSRGSLKPDCKALLEKIGFSWRVRREPAIATTKERSAAHVAA